MALLLFSFFAWKWHSTDELGIGLGFFMNMMVVVDIGTGEKGFAYHKGRLA